MRPEVQRKQLLSILAIQRNETMKKNLTKVLKTRTDILKILENLNIDNANTDTKEFDKLSMQLRLERIEMSKSIEDWFDHIRDLKRTETNDINKQFTNWAKSFNKKKKAERVAQKEENKKKEKLEKDIKEQKELKMLQDLQGYDTDSEYD